MSDYQLEDTVNLRLEVTLDQPWFNLIPFNLTRKWGFDITVFLFLMPTIASLLKRDAIK
jgi:hypothetical protein